MKQRDRARSVARGPGEPRRRRGAKPELAVMALLAVVAAVAVALVRAPFWLELLILAAVGFAGGGWLAARARGSTAGARDDEEHS